jgi:hypothetical protein
MVVAPCRLPLLQQLDMDGLDSEVPAGGPRRGGRWPAPSEEFVPFPSEEFLRFALNRRVTVESIFDNTDPLSIPPTKDEAARANDSPARARRVC